MTDQALASSSWEVADAFEANELYQREGLTDGLPVVPPTRGPGAPLPRGGGARAGRRGRHRAGAPPPHHRREGGDRRRDGGGPAQYMPVALALVRAVAAPEFGLHGCTASTGGSAPFVVVKRAHSPAYRHARHAQCARQWQPRQCHHRPRPPARRPERAGWGVVRFWRWMSISSSVTAACTETSSAETGSSATTTVASPAKARAMPMRCFWPPDSWRGMRDAKARGSLTRSSSSRSAASISRRVLRDAEFLQHADDLRADRMAGVQRVERVLEHHLEARPMARRALARSAGGRSPMPLSMTSPPVAVSRPISTLAKVDLPQPDSPTIATVSASRASKSSFSLALTKRDRLPPNSAANELSRIS